MTIDLRNLTFEHSTEEVNFRKTNDLDSIEIRHLISANVGDSQVGYMKFIQYENVPRYVVTEEFDTTIVDKCLYVDYVEVLPQYQQLGMGLELYKEFGNIYNEQFNGWPVARYFVNPIAEYSFRKAVSLGWISENALTEEYITRRTPRYEKNKDLVNDLRNKLPENVRGPETWSKKITRKDIRKKGVR